MYMYYNTITDYNCINAYSSYDQFALASGFVYVYYEISVCITGLMIYVLKCKSIELYLHLNYCVFLYLLYFL